MRPGAAGEAGTATGGDPGRLGGGAWRRAARRAAALGALAGASLLAGGAGTAAAQEVRFPEPRPESPAQRDLARFVETERYQVLVHDTILARGDTVRGNLLVLEAAVRIAGRVEGSVYVADGDLFLRPGARIGGDLVVVGGGFYSSGLAEVGGRTVYRPNERVRVLPEAGGFLVFAPEEERETLSLGPLYGLRLPTYQRVDGWTFRWGGAVRANAWPWRPELEGEVRYRTEQDALEGSAALHGHLGRRLRLTAEGGRRTRSNEAWIRADALNTLSYLFLGNDYRDYYRADWTALRAEVRPAGDWTLFAGAAWERARSLEAMERTVLFRSDEPRGNPEVDEDEAASFLLGAELRSRNGLDRTRLLARVEGAHDDAAGDFSFLLAEARGSARRILPHGHALELFALARGDLAGALPRQRWSGLGGVGTLPTLPVLALRGPRAVLAEVTYLVPLPFLDVPTVGPTEVLLRGVAGSAWGAMGERPRFTENLVAGIRIFFLETAVAWDPGGTGRDVQFYVTSRFPRG